MDPDTVDSINNKVSEKANEKAFEKRNEKEVEVKNRDGGEQEDATASKEKASNEGLFHRLRSFSTSHNKLQ